VTPGKPVLFVTNHVPPERVGAFAALHERVPLELAIFGGRSTHATAGVEDPGVPHRHVRQQDIAGLAASRRYRAVVCGTAGRIALPAAALGARARGVPFVLWTALWAHPRTPAHIAGGAPLLATLYRTADAVVAYGPHVAAFARARGARNVHVAPQAVDNAFWGAAVEIEQTAPFTAVFLGRPSRAKGAVLLLDAWRSSGLGASAAALVLVGAGTGFARSPAGGAVAFTGPQPPVQVRNFLAAADVLVIPSLRTRSFREPWGLVANEAMNQSTPVIATDEVGAVAGGLVRHERNGLVVPAGDAGACTTTARCARSSAPTPAATSRPTRSRPGPAGSAPP
jgi:glycosyltransferase involved in cell wall biosynthesis